jgi:hypothetical protein
MKLIIETGIKVVLLCNACCGNFIKRHPEYKVDDVTGRVPPEQRCDMCRNTEFYAGNQGKV